MTIDSIPTGPFKINTYAITIGEKPRYAIVVDPCGCSLTHDAAVVSDYLGKQGLSLLAVFLTHGHFDHIMGTRALKDAFPQAPLLCHSEDSFMVGENAALVQESALNMMGLHNLTAGLVNLPNPDATFKGGEDFSMLLQNCDVFKSLTDCEKKDLSKWHVIHTPGHTRGSSCFHYSCGDDAPSKKGTSQKDVLVSGDTVFFQSYGRTDLGGGSESQIIKSLNGLYKSLKRDTLVYPGHEEFGFAISMNY